MDKWFLCLAIFSFVSYKPLMYEFNARIVSYNNYIIIKINGPDKKQIVGIRNSVGSYSIPDIIVINGKKQSSNSDYYYSLNKTENIVKLEWNDKLINCNYMFFDCSAIIEIDLYNFDSSLVTQTYYMFYGCTLLTSLNLTNFITSNVTLMGFMFSYCESLTSLNLSNFDTSQVESMYSMFDDCFSLTLLDLSNFNTAQVESMEEMFSNCWSLTSLNLSNFYTNNLNNIDKMFYNCSKLEYLDIKNFIFEEIESYSDIFNLTPKNMVICNEGSQIQQIINDLNECKIISCSIDWKQDKKEINSETGECIKSSEDNNGKSYELKTTTKILDHLSESAEIDLKESYGVIIQETTNDILTTYIENYSELNNVIRNNQCNLSYNIDSNEEINLNILLKYQDNNNIFKENIKYGCKIILKEKNVKLNLSKVEFNYLLFEFQQYFDNCYNDLDQNKTLYILNITINKDENDYIQNLYEVYYPSEKDGSLTKLNLNILDINCPLKTWLSKCASYSIESITSNKCLSCENKFGFYPKYKNNNNSFIECFNSIDGYYLDEKSKVFKKCYKTCEKCNISGNEERHNCLSCKKAYEFENIANTDFGNCYKLKNNSSDYNNISIINCNKNDTKFIPANNICINDCSKDEIYKYEFNNTCYEECPTNSTVSKENKFYCEIICPKEKPYELIESHQCIENCSISEMFKNICTINYKEENKTKSQNLGKKIVEEILNGNLGKLINQVLINKTDIIIYEDYAIHQLNSLNNKDGKNNISFVDFKQCEELLRKKYGLNDTEELIIYKIDHKIEGFNIPIIEYILFTQNGSINLNLNICDNTAIQYNIPVSINENEIDKYNPSSDFYNDQCNKYSINGSIDVTLFDRKNEFNNNNLSLCESKCEFKGYNSSSSKAICVCHIKNNITYSYNDINPDDLLNKIQSEKSSSNLGVTQCLSVFSSPEEIKYNSGFYTLLFILIIFVIVFIIFCIKGRHLLENKIDEVIYNKFEKNKKETEIDNKENNTILNTNNHNNKKSYIKKKKKKGKKRNNKIEPKTGSNLVFQGS